PMRCHAAGATKDVSKARRPLRESPYDGRGKAKSPPEAYRTQRHDEPRRGLRRIPHKADALFSPFAHMYSDKLARLSAFLLPATEAYSFDKCAVGRGDICHNTNVL